MTVPTPPPSRLFRDWLASTWLQSSRRGPSAATLRQGLAVWRAAAEEPPP